MLAVGPQDAISQLEALAASARLSARDVQRCARLADTLRRPARVCLLGPDGSDLSWIVAGFLGPWPMSNAALPAAVELRYGPTLRSVTTLEDGTALAQDGWPTEDLLHRDPVFLQVELPLDLLCQMSLLVLSLEPHPAMYRPALSWAARRSEIAVWCTRSFGTMDARIWATAPERLTQHAYLLEAGPIAPGAIGADTRDFSQTFTVQAAPGSDAGLAMKPLLDRLTSDIEDARLADLDMAQLFLHRLGHLAPLPSGGDVADHSGPTPGLVEKQGEDMRVLLSEPLLFLMARAGALNEDLSQVPQPEDWQELVLSHCVETIEGMRARAENWPEDIADVQSLRAMIDEISDLTTLLQIENGPEQAQDASALLFQLRVAFEQALGWEAA